MTEQKKKRTSAFEMQREVDDGRAPTGIRHADAARGPFELDHVHAPGEGADRGMNYDGTLQPVGMSFEPGGIEDVGPRFAEWLLEALPCLDAWNSADMHVDTLFGRDVPGETQLEAAMALIPWILEEARPVLVGKVVMLLIPLENTDAPLPEAPAWSEVAAQLTGTPPSVYVMRSSAYLQPDPRTHYVAPIVVPGLPEDDVAATYHCWRHPDYPEGGWARDLRILVTGLLQPASAHSAPGVPGALQAYGYPVDRPAEMDGPWRLTEVSFVANPDLLRNIAGFLVSCAETIERRGEDFPHAHFRDECAETWDALPQGSSDVIVIRPQ